MPPRDDVVHRGRQAFVRDSKHPLQNIDDFSDYLSGRTKMTENETETARDGNTAVGILSQALTRDMLAITLCSKPGTKRLLIPLVHSTVCHEPDRNVPNGAQLYMSTYYRRAIPLRVKKR